MIKTDEYQLRVGSVNLTYNKGKGNAYQSLFNVSLNIKRGEFVVIFGPSGCGKSSLLNCIAGLEVPDDGEIFVEDKNIIELSEKESVAFHRRKLGMIFQSYNLIPTLNVLDNVALPQIFINRPKKERIEKAMALLAEFGIQEHWQKVPSELSGGQQQRIGIARSIANDPPIVLADEPIGNLDTVSANNVMQILSKLNKEQGKTIVLVSHNPENIIWGTHIVYMKDGKITKEEYREVQENMNVEESAKARAVDGEDGEESLFDSVVNRFKGLSDEQVGLLMSPLRAKSIVEFLVHPYNDTQIKTFEDGVASFLGGTLNQGALLEVLDKDQEAFGVGLDKRRAKNFMKEMIFLSERTRLFSASESISEKVILVLDYVTEFIELHLSEKQLKVLGGLVKKRILGKISYLDFKRKLRQSTADGVGIDKRTVEKVVRRIDLFLLVSYGMVKKESKAEEVEGVKKTRL